MVQERQVGHSVYRKSKPVFKKTHHWKCYVDSWNRRYPLSEFVEKVTFKLHETFENPKQIVRKEPFAIEEDGFGNFQLQIEVNFLDLLTSFTYDITLFDRNELHAFRTVRLDVGPEEWPKYARLGGIAFPKSATQADVQQLLRSIQSSSNPETLHAFSFFPELADPLSVQLPVPLATPSVALVDSQHRVKKSPGKNRPNREARSQALANLGVISSSPSVPQRTSTPSSTVSSTSSSVVGAASLSSTAAGSVSSSAPVEAATAVQKHKKKLQLKHEAQLLLEQETKQQQSTTSNDPLGGQSSIHHQSVLPSTTTAPLQRAAVPRPPQKERLVLKLSRSDIESSLRGSHKKKKSRRLKGEGDKHRSAGTADSSSITADQFVASATSSPSQPFVSRTGVSQSVAYPSNQLGITLRTSPRRTDSEAMSNLRLSGNTVPRAGSGKPTSFATLLKCRSRQDDSPAFSSLSSSLSSALSSKEEDESEEGEAEGNLAIGAPPDERPYEPEETVNFSSTDKVPADFDEVAASPTASELPSPESQRQQPRSSFGRISTVVNGSSSNSSRQRKAQPLGAFRPASKDNDESRQFQNDSTIYTDRLTSGDEGDVTLTRGVDGADNDPLKSTMVWISSINGGPQRFVSPLLPPGSPNQPITSASQLKSNINDDENDRLLCPPIDTDVGDENDDEGSAHEASATDDDGFGVFQATQIQQESFHRKFLSDHKLSSSGTKATTTTAMEIASEERASSNQKSSKRQSSSNEKSLPNLKTKKSRRLQTPVRHQVDISLGDVSRTSTDSSTPPMSVEPVNMPIEINIPPVTKEVENEQELETTSLYLDNEALELLFDRLLRLEDESLARRMSSLLLAYASEPAAVEVLNSSPQIVAFDLRRLPLECIAQLVEVITEDESLSVARLSAADLVLSCENNSTTAPTPESSNSSRSRHRNSHHRSSSLQIRSSQHC